VRNYCKDALLGPALALTASLWALEYKKKPTGFIWALIGALCIVSTIYISTLTIIVCTSNEVVVDLERMIAPAIVSVLCLLAAAAVKYDILKVYMKVITGLNLVTLFGGIYIALKFIDQYDKPSSSLLWVVFYSQLGFLVCFPRYF